MKTSELTGAQLDYWVAKAEGRTHAFISPREDAVWDPDRDEVYAPSSNWSQGGPIVEREFLQLVPPAECNRWHVEGWSCYIEEGRGIEQFGATPLIAAMRAYVASKFGEEVGDTP